MSLTLSSQPGFTQIPGTSFASNAPVTAAVMQELNASAQFAAVRNEQFYGYYKNGETVQLPVSPADGYQYQRDELLYSFSWYSTGGQPTACDGTQTPPTPGSTTGQGTVLQTMANVDQSTGLVTTQVSYYKASQMNQPDGVLLVITHAQRNR